MTETPLAVYVISIARAADRMAALQAQADRLGIALTRVAGIDGTQIAAGERRDVDDGLFFARNGRTMLAGEYGCYRSHLLAYQQIVDGGVPAAVIVEDDVALDADFMGRACAIHRAMPQADVVKLVNHRAGGFRAVAVSDRGDRIGRCRIGPQGSGACYLVTRRGAQRLLSGLAVMSLPADVALERGWASGVAVYTVEKNILPFGSLREATMIGTRADYRAAKQPSWRRLPAYLFRFREAVSRFFYALKGARWAP